MHRHNTLYRQQIIEDAEHRLLHFARISGAANQDQLFGKVDRNHRLAAATMARRVRAEAWQIDDGVFGFEACQFLRRRAHQQRPDEQIMPRKFVDDADIDAMLRLRPTEQVRDV